MQTLEQLAVHDVEEAARMLLGCKLLRTLSDGTRLSGVIVETEAYHESDPASHAFGGKTARNAPMFGPAGRAYVYFTYGMHHCMNIVTGKTDEAAAVLIRAIEPETGIGRMAEFRNNTRIRSLCSGPGKLTQAFAIGRDFNGHELARPPLQLIPSQPVAGSEIIRTTRVGITNAQATPWRFYIKNNPFISKS